MVRGFGQKLRTCHATELKKKASVNPVLTLSTMGMLTCSYTEGNYTERKTKQLNLWMD